ncbi:MAG: hypothetical protein IKK96_03525 [Lachnospiraceae bacterium]|nr:hypothetical protein [Lachnospiraceae bacterium]
MEQPSKELTEFDSVICDSRIQVIKAAIPFASPREQRFLSVYVKYIELSKTINLAKNLRPDSLGVCSICKKPSGENGDFLQTIRKYCSSSEREMIDSFLSMINTVKTLLLFKETLASCDVSEKNDTGDTSQDNSMFNILKSRLSPEQQEMFDMYSSMINN